MKTDLLEEWKTRFKVEEPNFFQHYFIIARMSMVLVVFYIIGYILNVAAALLYLIIMLLTSHPFTFRTCQRMKWYLVTLFLGFSVSLIGLAETHSAMIIHNTGAATALIYYAKQWPKWWSSKQQAWSVKWVVHKNNHIQGLKNNLVYSVSFAFFTTPSTIIFVSRVNTCRIIMHSLCVDGGFVSCARLYHRVNKD